MANGSFVNCFRPNSPLERETLGARRLSGSAQSYRKAGSDHETRQSLRRLVKAIFFHTLLVNKIKSKSSQNNSYASKYKAILSKAKRAPQIFTNSQTNDFKKNSIHSIPCSSIKSSFSSGSSVLLSTSFRRTEYLEDKQANHPSASKMLIRKNQGVFFFLVCLFSLTCLGKVCAIICTSTIFVLVWSRVKRVKMAVDGRESKKSLK